VTGMLPFGCIGSSQPGHRTTGKATGASFPTPCDPRINGRE
jgi:hypothetical protein